MILFGYKTTYGTIIRALCAIGVGGVMVFMPNRGTELLVKIIGAVIFAAGLVSLTISIINRKEVKSNQFTFNLILACIVGGLGLLLIFFPEILTKTIIVVAGLGLIIFGGLQMLVVGGAASMLGMGYTPVILGAFALAGGIVILFNPFTEQVMSIIAGAFLIYYGLSELLSLKKVTAARKEYEIKFSQTGENPVKEVIKGSVNTAFGNVKDAEYTKVDDQ